MIASPNCACIVLALSRNRSLCSFSFFLCASYSAFDFTLPICSDSETTKSWSSFFLEAAFSNSDSNCPSLFCADSIFVLIAAISLPLVTVPFFKYSFPNAVVFKSVLPMWLIAASIKSRSNIENKAFLSFPAESFPLTRKSAIMLSPSKKKYSDKPEGNSFSIVSLGRSIRRQL